MWSKIKRYFQKKNLSTINNRKKVGIILFATSIGLFFLLATRLSYIVLVGKVGDVSLEAKTSSLYQGSEVVKAKRGTIYDRNGLPIAEDATSYSLRAVLSDTYMQGDKKLYAEEENFDQLANILNTQLGIKKEEALSVLKNGAEQKLFQVEFSQGKNITVQQKQAIEKSMKDAKIAGFYFDEHPSRSYPNGVFSSHFIGYADIQTKDDQEGLVGRLGLEEAYDDILKGKDGKIIFQKDNFQNPLPGTVAETTAAQDGKDIYTTLDARLQTYLETLMDEVYADNNPENMTAMLVHAKTGEIVSMGQRPTFNPETKAEFSQKDFNWFNLLVQDTYEPGSTMKILTTAAAMDEGIFNEYESFTSGKIKLEDTTISDWDHGEKGVLNMRQALSWSSNVGMVMLEQRMQTRWQRYLQQFGFGQSTYSGLPGEIPGILPENNPVSKAMSSFGQAVGVTNFQMMQAFTAVANDGKMLRPHYVKKIVDPNTKEEIVTQPEVVGNPISAESAQKVREYMRDVVENEKYGSAYGRYKVPGFNIAAKTGTGEVIAPGGGYLGGGTNYLYSIVEMLPAEDPEYILYLTIKLPQSYDYQALPNISNPLLKRTMELNETITGETVKVNNEKVKVEDYRNLETSIAARDVQKRGLNPVVLGTGTKVKEQSLKNGLKVMPGEKLLLLTDSDKYYMPDTKGWSKADLIKLGKILNIEVNFDGNGYCVEQSIAPYEEIAGKEINFKLKER